MTFRSVSLAVLFGGSLTAAELLLVASLSAPTTPPEPTKRVRKSVVVDTPPPPPVPRDQTMKPLEAARIQNRSAPPAPTPLIQQAALQNLPPIDGLSLASALPGLTHGLGGVGLGLARMTEPDREAIVQRRPAPRYPNDARRRGVEGFVVLRMRVNVRGQVDDAVVVEAEPPGIFDRSAKSAALAYRFSPARSGGRSVASTVEQKMNFRLR
ncbi:MAG: energy transducer TonB [Myxococcota bacterium]